MQKAGSKTIPMVSITAYSSFLKFIFFFNIPINIGKLQALFDRICKLYAIIELKYLVNH